MIVLDATNKSLGMRSTGTINLAAVVSYWSVDALNMWTPHQFEQTYSANFQIPQILLAPPSTGETTVVENIWLHINSALVGNQDLRIIMGTPLGTGTGVPVTERIFAMFTNPSSGNAIPTDTTFMMNRQGKWARQYPVFGGTTVAQSNNVF